LRGLIGCCWGNEVINIGILRPHLGGAQPLKCEFVLNFI
jgi:hypothetical protein